MFILMNLSSMSRWPDCCTCSDHEQERWTIHVGLTCIFLRISFVQVYKLYPSYSIVLTFKMKYFIILAMAALVGAQTPYGIDISDYQPNVDWTTVVDNGISFVYIKATEGTGKDFPSSDIGTPMMEGSCRLYLSFLQQPVYRCN